MIGVSRLFRARSARPYLTALAVVIVMAVADGGHGRFLSMGTASSVLQQFATVAPVALAVGMTMILREFDLSVAGMSGLAGCVAVLAGADHPLLGLLAATAIGAIVGVVQGLIMIGLGLGSVPVTLGGLLTTSGVAYVITGNSAIGYPRLDVAMLINAPLLSVVSIRSAAAIIMVALAAIIMRFTRLGRDIVAVGSDRSAAATAGVSVSAIVVGVFVASAVLASLGGALLSYSIAAAAPGALSNTLVPAVAAAIIGGVSLSGGKGSPVGIAGGVLVLCILRSSMSSIGLPPYVQDVATGGVLLAVALLDAEDLVRRLYPLRARRRVPPIERMDMKVGLIGLGRMGLAMAQRLGEQGFAVVAWDIDAQRCKAAARVGASIARDPADVVEQTDTILSIVTDDAAVEWLFAKERGARVAGKLFVEMSTLRPDTVRRLAADLETRGARLIGAPVMGSIPTVHAGQLLMLAGGREEDIERARPALAALTRQIVHVGPVGSGNAMKLIVNLSMAAYLQALAEGLALGGRQGLDLDLMLSVLGEAPTANGWLKAKLPALKGEDADTTLDILALRKDVMSAVATGAADGVAMPLAAGVLSALTAAVAAGFGGADLAQMPRFVRESMVQEPSI